MCLLAACILAGVRADPPGSPVSPLDRIGSISALLRFALAIHAILLAHSCPLSVGLRGCRHSAHAGECKVVHLADGLVACA
jgi:hypothetical protein